MLGGGKAALKIQQIVENKFNRWQMVFLLFFFIPFQDKLKDFLDKKDRGELLIQKASNLLQSILKKVGVWFHNVDTSYSSSLLLL